MQLSSDALFQAALQLPEEERLGLAARLLDAAPSDLTIDLDDPQLRDELDRRFADDDGAIRWSDLSDEGS
ncbi:MAG TPA: hypothetical protein VFB96_19950 [Pirellulaceae bacterium]|nr:hypothetical protein [Pirellulaceae bacterium]